MRAALPKILLATFGSLGDLHPFIALGQALQREGFAVVLATSSNHREAVEAQGLGFTAISPDLQEVTDRLGLDLGGLARRMSADNGFLFKDVIFPHLREAYDQLLAASEDVVAIVAHSIAFAAHAAAEKRGLPLVVVALSPVLLCSTYDPPFASGLPFVPSPRGRLALAYNRDAARPARALRRILGGASNAVPPKPWPADARTLRAVPRTCARGHDDRAAFSRRCSAADLDCDRECARRGT